MLIAEAAGVGFRAPLLGGAGCQAPGIAPFTPLPQAQACPGRLDRTPSSVLNTVAIPGLLLSQTRSAGGNPNLQMRRSSEPYARLRAFAVRFSRG